MARGFADPERGTRHRERGTGGTYLEKAETPLKLTGAHVARYVEIWPWLMIAFLGVFLVDLAVRRWENVLGVVDLFRRKRVV